MFSVCHWLTPPSEPIPLDDTVHLWLASMDSLTSNIELLEKLLDADERERAGRFYFASDRNRFVAARAVLRMILSRYVSLPPEELDFCYGQFGKPALTVKQGRGNIEFNLSHSRDLVLYVITRNARVGVDVEYISSFPEINRIVEQTFDGHEKKVWRDLIPRQQTEYFFRHWTRREAFVKSEGKSLAMSSVRFDFDYESGGSGDPNLADRELENNFGWSACELIPMPGYCASIVVEGKARLLRCWRWAETNSVVGDFNFQERTV